MEKDRTERYAESLERIIRGDHAYLKEAVPDFQEKCRLLGPGKNIPHKVVADIREMYKEMRNRLTEIKAVQQLLNGKYRRYYHRDPSLEKDVTEFGFITKNTYSKFESVMLQRQRQEALREKEKEQPVRMKDRGTLFHWFRSQENQVRLLRNVKLLHELDYEEPPQEVGEERRAILKESVRSLTLFIFSGAPESIDHLQTRFRVREHDVLERYGPRELRGLFVHLREIRSDELENLFRRLLGSGPFSGVRCLLFSFRSPKDLDQGVMSLVENALSEIKEGEVRTISAVPA